MLFKVAIQFTDEMDAALREAYLNYEPGKIHKLSQELRCSHKVIRRRADKLKLPKIRQNRYNIGYRRWTGPEVRLLLENESLSSRQLEAVFHKNGYVRSDGGIDCFRRLHHAWLAAHHQDEFEVGYSTFQLQDLLGIDSSTIVRWIHKKLLKAHQPKADALNFRIRREDLLRFLIEHPARWDCKKVDTYWLMDLVQERMVFKKS